MKFEVHRDDMRNLLGHVTRVIERNQTREILSNAVVSIDSENKLRLGCTDLETTITAQLQLFNVEELGEVTIPGLRLFEIFGRIAAGSDVELETHENTVSISSPGKKFNLATLPPEQLRNTVLNPNLDTSDADGSESSEISLSLKSLTHLLSKTSFAMAAKALRSYLNGTMFEVNERHLRTVATNGVVMGICTDVNGKQEGEERQIIVPRKAIHELEFLLSDSSIPSSDEEDKKDEQVELVVTAKTLTVNRGPLQLVTNLINSRYPQYEMVIPKDSEDAITCRTNDLLDAVRSAVICSTENNHAIKFTANDGVLRIESSNERGDSAGIELPISSSENELIFTVDGQHFDGMLQHVDAEQVSIHVPDDSSNLKIVGEGADNYCYIVSRMRM